ncbi:MAG: alpha/beta hydrolase [Planctomycetes bacterium]|nr:alpha/beta hydrolase [Planctomycetota bacterium]
MGLHENGRFKGVFLAWLGVVKPLWQLVLESEAEQALPDGGHRGVFRGRASQRHPFGALIHGAVCFERSTDYAHGMGPAPLKRMLPIALCIAILAYLGLCLLLYLFQNRAVFFPGRPPQATPATAGLEYEDVRLKTRDGVSIHGWWIPRSEATGVILVAHGNAGNIADRLGLARAFHELDFSVLLFDYRGYGNSEGTPTEEGVYLDGEAAYEYLTDERGIPPSRIVLFGESLGGGVAVQLASRHACRALITESAFTSVPDVAAEIYPWFPTRLLVRNRFANADKLGSIQVPYLTIHSPEDELIPFSHGERLHAVANEPKRLLRTSGGHNDGGFQSSEGYRHEVGVFLRGVFAGDE